MVQMVNIGKLRRHADPTAKTVAPPSAAFPMVKMEIEGPSTRGPETPTISIRPSAVRGTATGCFWSSARRIGYCAEGAGFVIFLFMQDFIKNPPAFWEMSVSSDHKSKRELRVFESLDELATDLTEYISQIYDISVKERSFCYCINGRATHQLIVDELEAELEELEGADLEEQLLQPATLVPAANAAHAQNTPAGRKPTHRAQQNKYY